MNRSIIAAAILISGSILLNGHLSRKTDDPRLSQSEIKKSVTESLEYSFSDGNNIIMNKKREVQNIEIDDIRYSSGDKDMFISFSLKCADGDRVQSGVRLHGDDFFTYRGSWAFDTKKANFMIGKNGLK